VLSILIPVHWQNGTSTDVIPVRSLDAMHLLIAKEIGAGVVVTADKVMADAATAFEFEVVKF